MWVSTHTRQVYNHRVLINNERSDLVGGKMKIKKSILKVHALPKEDKIISIHVKLISFYTLKDIGKIQFNVF